MYRFAATLGAGALLTLSVGEPAAQAPTIFQAPKPSIQPPSIRPPVVTPNIPVRRLADDGQESGDSGPGETAEKASVATEPTRPASPAVRRAAAPVRPWLPATSPLPLPRVVERGPRPALLPETPRGRDHGLEDENRTGDQPDERHIERDDTLAGARTRELDVPDGLREMFDVTGGNINDLARLEELAGLRAVQELGPAADGNPLDDVTLGRDRFGAGTEAGPPTADTFGLGSGGKAAADWTVSYRFIIGNSKGTHYTASTPYGTATMTITTETTESGATITEITETTPGPNKTSYTSTTRIFETSPDEEGRVRTIERNTDSEGNETLTIGTREPDDETDREPAGGGEGDAGETTAGGAEEGETEDTTAGGGDQGAPNDNSTGGGTGGCGVWTPFGGCTGTGPKVWETTGQPDPTDDGSSTVRSAGASIGPEAVTNTGDGSFGASGNIGGGGGFGRDPCATVKGCGGPGGGGGPGPEGPPQP